MMPSLSNQLIMVGMAIFLLPAGKVFAAEPFAMEISYDSQGHRLVIELERLSRDEMEHAMQKLVVYKNNQSQLEEQLLNQNHLHKITKYIDFLAAPEDIIKVILHFGEDKELVEEIGVAPLEIEESKEPSAQKKRSVLIKTSDLSHPQDKKAVESIPRSEPATQIIKKEVDTSSDKSYGYKDYGYEPEEQRYGYTQEESDLYGSEGNQKPYGYSIKPKPYGKTGYGYEDPGVQDHGQKGYGYVGEKSSYGRSTYEE